MDIDIHNQILWRACVLAAERLEGKQPIADPRACFPLLVRGSWMNDTNQATLLLDNVQPHVDVNDDQLRFFRGLWQVAQAEVLERLAPEAPEVIQRARELSEHANHADDFSAYQPLDHLDIEKDLPSEEYKDYKERLVAKTVRRATTLHVPSRLRTSTIDNSAADRLEPAFLTALGRALHTIADFFAHSNYVELLLWSASRRNHLPADLVTILTGVVAPFGGHQVAMPRFSLPKPNDGPVHDGFMWYGASPEATPLVSTLFDTKDTAHSLLEMYAAHLEREDVPPPSSDDIDMLLAVFQVPGKAVIGAAWDVYAGARDTLAAIGAAVRKFLVDAVEAVVKRQGQDTQDRLSPLITLMRNYDSHEAREWARAGQFRYLVHVLDADMLAELANQSPNVRKLPHHSLLAKDHPPIDNGGRLRHALACRLAAELSADVLEWHFSSAPRPDLYQELASRCFLHPTTQLDDAKPVIQANALVKCLEQLRGADWYSSPTDRVFTWHV